MARIIKEIEIEGKALALFDTGACQSYITQRFVKDIPKRVIPEPYYVGLGGKSVELGCLLWRNGK